MASANRLTNGFASFVFMPFHSRVGSLEPLIVIVVIVCVVIMIVVMVIAYDDIVYYSTTRTLSSILFCHVLRMRDHCRHSALPLEFPLVILPDHRTTSYAFESNILAMPQVVNLLDDGPPPDVHYITQRSWATCVNVVLDPGFLACCDCTDNCQVWFS